MLHYPNFPQKKSIATAYIAVVFIAMFTSATIWANTKVAPKSKKLTIGWLEKVQINPSGLRIVAKADTGAKTSSIRAEILKFKQKEGKPWVRFKLIEKTGETFTMEKPVVRTAKIKKHGGGFYERPVVMLGICLGKIYQEVEVSLSSRKSFNYTAILGRSYLKDRFIVDVSRKFSVKPECGKNKVQ